MKKRVILLVALLVASATYLGYGFAALHPSRSIYLPVLALGIPLGQFLCGFLALVWVWRYKWAAAIVVSPLVMDFGFFQATLPLHYPHKAASDDITVLTWNTESLNFYTNSSARRLPRSQAALSWLVSHPADVKFMQEFIDIPARKIKKKKKIEFNTSKIFVAQGQQMAFWDFHVDRLGGRHGLAIATRGRIIGQGEITSPVGQQKALWVDIILKSDTLRAICVHLESMAFKDTDFEIESEKNLHHVLSHYAHFSQIRTSQTLALLNFIRQSPHPVILAGDFNDPPHSYNYWKLSALLTDCFANAGLGLGFTLAKKPYLVRIDRIYTGTGLRPKACRVLRGLSASDHYAVEAEIVRD